MTFPSVSHLKAQAKRLRTAMANAGDQSPSHSKSLELLAAQYGFRDWNTLHAAASGPAQFPFAVGDRVRGCYMKQPFTGEVVGLNKVGPSGHHRVTLQFDTPVDVVSFDSFSSFRSRVSCIVREDGIAVKKTSDGNPYLKMNLAA
ncbi:MAG: glyoxalase superfamily protein [Roseibium sp.]